MTKRRKCWPDDEVNEVNAQHSGQRLQYLFRQSLASRGLRALQDGESFSAGCLEEINNLVTLRYPDLGGLLLVASVLVSRGARAALHRFERRASDSQTASIRVLNNALYASALLLLLPFFSCLKLNV